MEDRLNDVTCVTWNLLNAWMPGTAVYKTATSRAGRAAEWILNCAPDIFCLQEFDYYYRHDTAFLSATGEWYTEAQGIGELPGDSWNPIFIRRGDWDRETGGSWNFTANGFTPVDTGNTQPQTYPVRSCNESGRYGYPPESAESGTEGSRFRSLSWVLLTRNGRRLLVANTHLSLRLWCQTAEADFIHERLTALAKTYDCPVLLCGDFNSGADVGGAKRMNALGWVDGHTSATVSDDRASCHPSSGKGEAQESDQMPAEHYLYAIDHAFLRDPAGQIYVGEYRIIAETALLSVSDHCPTVLRFSLNSKNGGIK